LAEETGCERRLRSGGCGEVAFEGGGLFEGGVEEGILLGDEVSFGWEMGRGGKYHDERCVCGSVEHQVA
jgi:hypothetical protein